MVDAVEAESKSMTEDELKTLCAEWQKRIRLQDWEVRIRYAHTWEIDNLNARAHVDWSEQHRYATIDILHPDDEVKDAMVPLDDEFAIVHELLHLHFVPFDAEAETTKGIAQEQAINAITGALVKLKREAQNEHRLDA